ncbi:DUF4258 domain-containing protein [Geothrix sp. 21YS21S-4]|uniref:DUF4258 domain-containing protein n=1 Tax=Geothrix sp. 21YS21S-4 TaxID=3068889 RepID=UPI0027B9DDA9|nr:DUF4258 domain-containing protein [Geothrix sp. 21YS21S-4]
MATSPLGAAIAGGGRAALGWLTSTGAAAWQGAKDLFSKGSQAAPVVQQEVQAVAQQVENPQSPLSFSAHALERMAERGVSQEAVTTAVEKGTTYFDKLNNTFTHVVQTANGKVLQVATSKQAGGNVVTTMVRSKFNDAVKLADGTERFVRK